MNNLSKDMDTKVMKCESSPSLNINISGNPSNNKDCIDDKTNDDIDYNYLFKKLLMHIKEAIDEINSSDYSKKSLGRFKEKIEKISTIADRYPKNL